MEACYCQVLTCFVVQNYNVLVFDKPLGMVEFVKMDDLMLSKELLRRTALLA